MLIGYARVSTHEQNLDLQLDALAAAGCRPENIYTDKVSTRKAADDRKNLSKVFELLREGDTLIVWRLDRLGRSTRELIDLMNKIRDIKANFKSTTENLDTTTVGGMLVFHIFAALAEFERDLIKERTNAGLAAARARGRLGGRPKALDQKKIERLRALYNKQDIPVNELLEMFQISRGTLYKYVDRKER